MDPVLQAQYDLALAIAGKAHAGHVDQAGAPYIEHPKAVAAMCRRDACKVIALLHDVIEDGGETEESLVAQGVLPEIARRVRLLSNIDGKDYLEYVRAAGADDLAREVKLADLTHNSDIRRIPRPTGRDWERLARYRRAFEVLGGEPVVPLPPLSELRKRFG
ncbi:MAG: GTP pyrophosphokinase [Duodenibacillus sp.]|nr:GTP pyrophosphokinase [Duodenibacillus sp.]